MHEDRRRRRFMSAAAAAVAVLICASACGAPASEPAGGEIGDRIRAALESGRDRFDHRLWDDLLSRGVHDGLVDYGFMQANRPALNRYLDSIARADLGALAGGQLEALLINAYNALTVRAILDHPGVSSIREIKGVWSEAGNRVGGFDVSLDTIEHNLLRPFFKDPRIHFAVNCASKSCAPLPPWAYDGDRIDAQLDERARAFLSDPLNVFVRDGTLHLSRYFDWYGEDFTKAGWAPRADSIPLFVAAYASAEVADAIRSRDGKIPVAFLEYDWSLNAVAQ